MNEKFIDIMLFDPLFVLYLGKRTAPVAKLEAEQLINFFNTPVEKLESSNAHILRRLVLIWALPSAVLKDFIKLCLISDVKHFSPMLMICYLISE